MPPSLDTQASTIYCIGLNKVGSNKALVINTPKACLLFLRGNANNHMEIVWIFAMHKQYFNGFYLIV